MKQENWLFSKCNWNILKLLPAWASTFELEVYLSALSPSFSPTTASVLLVKPTSNYEWHHKYLRKRCDLYYQKERVTSRFDISIGKSFWKRQIHFFFFKSWQEILQNEKGDHKWDALYIEVLSLWHHNQVVSTVSATVGRLSRKEHFAHQMSNFSDGNVMCGLGQKKVHYHISQGFLYSCVFIFVFRDRIVLGLLSSPKIFTDREIEISLKELLFLAGVSFLILLLFFFPLPFRLRRICIYHWFC